MSRDSRLARLAKQRVSAAAQIPEPTEAQSQAALLAFIHWDPDSGDPNPLDGFPVSREIPARGGIDAALGDLLTALDEMTSKPGPTL